MSDEDIDPASAFSQLMLEALKVCGPDGNAMARYVFARIENDPVNRDRFKRYFEAVVAPLPQGFKEGDED